MDFIVRWNLLIAILYVIYNKRVVSSYTFTVTDLYLLGHATIFYQKVKYKNAQYQLILFFYCTI